jgi:glycosyltransferase involved in cell wall biosynthesis
MRIVHFAPFAPCGCGLYEAARDMVVADAMFGHESVMVDTGIIVNGEHTPGSPGKIDNRGAFELKTADPVEAFGADVLVAHTGVPDPWIAPCQAPIIWVLHGRPGACFRPEQFGNGHSYSLIANISKWPRVKAMVSFWPYHAQFWEPVIPEEKLVVFDAPPIDERRFSPFGPTHEFGQMGGQTNVMLADSWREDVDIYEVTHGAIEAAKKAKGAVKFHFYGMENANCWEYLFSALRNLGGLGEVWARRPNLEEVYRAADLFLSPHRIVVRTIGEALSCGTPVAAAKTCEFATYGFSPDEPGNVSYVLQAAINEITSHKDEVAGRVKKTAESFSLGRYAQEMNAVYERIAHAR